ncbi:spliceosome-associated protein CWC27 homolog [Eriocheir sinensis]|uniref:spliceosome-associated protein CWC27 homolog n=1 Tax=Eriocheir sinensis TaxID=95602 RepID=UPI0021C5F308|nr:spliceosome-associated protein CWC27 homolog [Eriocheir sinensis]XP_050693084.1 spliceosome-associated protein CWC27 homolog [Eriocheir sinensis]
MSSIYIQEPASIGKVLLVTTAGDFDVELWSREAPKACRNFVQLCLEGYYDGTIFHRVVPGFIIQGGDPTGTGTGGESIYGKPFKDEFHTRLRFVRRGLVAMANAGPNDNGSQFFFTLGQTPELQNKHTIFGKITGNTLYNLPRFEEGIIDKDERPEYPHKILKTEVLSNPFPDIVPRLKIENEVPEEDRKKKKKKKGTKNFKLLSFGDEAEEEEEEVLAATKNFSTKGNSAHDIAMDPTLSASTGKALNNGTDSLDRIKRKLRREDSTEGEKIESLEVTAGMEENTNEEEEEEEEEEEKEKEKVKKEEEVPAYRSILDEEKRAKDEKMAEMRAEIKQLKQDLTGKKLKAEKELKEEEEEEEKDAQSLKEYKKERQKYEEAKKHLPHKGASREDQTLALLQRFQAKMSKVVYHDSGSEGEDGGGGDKEEEGGEDKSEGAADDDDDDDDTAGWMKHKFFFGSADVVLAKDASTKDDHWYDVSDPRNAINKRRRDDISRPSKRHHK